MSNPNTVRVRFAPSPTGPLHIGTVRTALYNFLHARATGGVFVLRIDDTDQARSTAESLADILEGLRWLGLDWDEGPESGLADGGPFGPYLQSQRLSAYRERVQQLVAAGYAYPCFATPAEVEEGRAIMQERVGVPMYDRRYRNLPKQEAAARIAAGDPHVVRFAVPEGKVVVHDAIKGDVEVDLTQIDDWVMLRNDGSPLYNLCSTIDDIDMQITDVIRGEDHFVNTVKQLLVFRALGAEPPRFAHLPLILGKDGKKLSKRKAQTNVLDYKTQGYPPEALVNFFTLLGWSFDGQTEIFSMEQAIEQFDLAKLGRSGSVFDEEKMTWMCGMYIRSSSVEQLADRVVPFLDRAALLTAQAAEVGRPWVENVVACYQERIEFYSQLPEKVAFFFRDQLDYDAKAQKNLRKKPEVADYLRAWSGSLDAVRLPPSWPNRPAIVDALRLPDGEARTLPDGFEWTRPSELEHAARGVADQLGIGFSQLVHPIRAALTGSAVGAGLFDIVYLLGKERVAQRVAAALAFLAESPR